MWGAIDRSGNNNRSKWSKLKKGDILLFFREKKYVSKMIIGGTEDSYEIAKMIWGEKIDHEEMNVDPISGETWQLIIYALPENVKQIDVPDSALNGLLGYQANFPGPLRAFDFTVVSDDRLKKLENQYGSVQKALESIGIQNSYIFDVKLVAFQMQMKLQKRTNGQKKKQMRGKKNYQKQLFGFLHYNIKTKFFKQ